MSEAAPASRPSRLVRALAIASLLALAALAGALVHAWASTVDLVAHEAYARALRRAEELDVRLDEEVAKVRLGVVTTYDGIVRVTDETEANYVELSRLPSTATGPSRETLQRRVAAYRRAFDEKRELVERFKTEQAVLRNSLRALPHNTERLIGTLGDRPELTRAVETLLHDVTLVVLAPSPERVEAARCSLGALGETVEGDPCPDVAIDRLGLPAALDAEIATLVRHARIVLDREGSVAGTVESLMALPVGDTAATARESYAEIHALASEEARERWLFVFLIALAALGTSASYIIVRLSSAAAALRETTGKLELALAAIQHERDREVELAALKTQFVSMTSHEFRTPLSVILSSADLIEAYGERWGVEKRAQHIERIQQATKAMSRMLDGVLLIGRAQAGMLKLTPAPVRLGELAAAVVDEVRSTVGAPRSIEYVDEAAKEEVWMDEKLLRHILTNLLSNAFKYSPDDSTVRFVVRHEGDEALFEVEDEGIGIPEGERDQLFEAFHRMSNATAIPGTGLGLAIVKKSVEIHRGAIDVESELGKGTKFSVRVPYVKEAA